MENRQLEVSLSFYRTSVELKERLIRSLPRKRNHEQELKYVQLETEIRMTMEFIGELESIRRRIRKRQEKTMGDY